jgi:hypothetical protein
LHDPLLNFFWLSIYQLLTRVRAGSSQSPAREFSQLRKSIEIYRADASDAVVSPMVLTNYAQQLHDIARVPEAQDYAERALQTASRAGDEIVVNQTLLRLSRIYRAQHDYPGAVAMLDQVQPRLRKALPPGHHAFAILTSERSLISQQQGDSRPVRWTDCSGLGRELGRVVD